jgi:hypothetical protein
MQSDGTLLAAGLFSLPIETLAGQLALLDEATLATVVKTKIANVCSDSAKDFGALVESKAKTLCNEPPEEIALRILGRLHEILDLPPRRYEHGRDFDDDAQEVVTGALAVLRAAHKEFRGVDLQSLVQHVITQMFGEVGKQFDQLSTAKKDAVVDAVTKYIDSLPAEQQARIRQELGAEKITAEYVRRGLVRGTLATAFATAVSVGGFPFYMGAVSLLATITGAIGVTLPFAAYTTLTSMIGVLANPLFLLPILAGGGIFAYTRQNRKLRQHLAILVLAQTAIAGHAADGTGTACRGAALTRWRTAWSDVTRCRTAYASTLTVQRERQAALDETRNAIAEQQRKDDALSAQRTRVLQRLARICRECAADLAHSDWGTDLAIPGKQLVQNIEKRHSIAARPVRDGLLTNRWDRLVRAMDGTAQGLATDMQAMMCAELLIKQHAKGTTPPHDSARAALNRISKLDDQIQHSSGELAALRDSKSRLEQELQKLQERAARQLLDTQQAEKRYWGLNKLL